MTASLNFPALHASHSAIWFAAPGKPAVRISKGEAIGRAAETPLIMLNAPLVAQRLGYPELSGLDLLELFAFVHPAQFMVPTPMGLARALKLPLPTLAPVPREGGGPSPEFSGLLGGGDAGRADANLFDPSTDRSNRNPSEMDPRLRGGPINADGDDSIADSAIPALLHAATAALFATLERSDWPQREGAWSSLQALAKLRWPWAGAAAKHLKAPEKAERWLFSRLPEWEEQPPRAQPRQVSLSEDAVEAQLEGLTGTGAERREGQRQFARTAAHIFAPRERKSEPHMLLAEAGTGIGKTLGYLAPASLWSQAAGGTVWISTYTKALQRQLSRETERIYGNEAAFRKSVVIRKGRENYLCLLNLEDALQGGFQGRAAVLAQLVARWAAYSRDGDMIGGDLPGWLITLFRRAGVTALTDRRGECVYAGCPHYRKCFIEHATRSSQHADLVIANHALVMVNAARAREQQGRPTRIIFDEGHHLHDAADSMFAVALTGQETVEMRRWVMGPEGKSRGRRRGLAARLSDVASYDELGGRAIEAARIAAEALPGEGWLARIREGAASGEIEQLLAAIRGTVYARDESGGEDAGYGLETELAELDGPLVAAALDAARAIDALHNPLVALGRRLEALIEDGPDWLDGPARARIEGALASLGWRIDLLAAWASLLGRIGGPADPDFVDWLALDRFEGREYDMGLHRRWLDPGKPLAEAVIKPSHGVLVTSATLKAGEDWGPALTRSGAVHLEKPPQMFAARSPFDYANQAQVLIVTDVKRGDMAGLAGAYGRLIEAAGGGALGLFTAIRRLRSVHGRIADRLAQSGLPLYAQHVDPMETGTLVDIFRDDPRASLLGTDSLRDGVDVPGHSLRLVIMEGVPWPKPDILHRARKAAGGGTQYDDMIIRARLAQAFGRLIRRADDRGRFVMLSSAFPSRLLSAFPAGTPVRRVTLSEALQAVQSGVSAQPMSGARIDPVTGSGGETR
ncbi:ATP-dependent DNA helicase [Blastomonas fulva]|uniref:ATP-dependent DNA helicase n=1 Tax=Blastomonas fulva TaxID=1550728 RepID=UPI0025A3287E|nr:ATP-dependent DNA helicase [Blastomonas fulva]MDM7967457.1 ATP-dependent DNA helicase [Blastomonas fulva]